MTRSGESFAHLESSDLFCAPSIPYEPSCFHPNLFRRPNVIEHVISDINRLLRQNITSSQCITQSIKQPGSRLGMTETIGKER